MTHRIRRLVDRQTENVRDSNETDKRYTNWIKERKIQEFYVVLHTILKAAVLLKTIFSVI